MTPRWIEAPECADDGYCRSCDGDRCTTGPECVTLGLDSEKPRAMPVGDGFDWRPARDLA